MNHSETIDIAEQRRAALLSDARATRAVRQARSNRQPAVRSWLTRVRHS
jgi:hypothetical protein